MLLGLWLPKHEEGHIDLTILSVWKNYDHL